MRIIPAIDLMDGRCVRLIKGEKKNMIVYEKTALEIAEEYWRNGARIIHVVDLDGAFTGEMKNLKIIKSLAERFQIQVGGGIRSEDKINELLGLGVKKVILSTLLLKDRAQAEILKKKYYGKLIGSFDFKDGKLSYAGWTKQSELSFEEVTNELYEIVVTDTSRDGTFSGPNLKLLESLKSKFSGKIIAAGGISSVEDLIKLDNVSVDGAIIGRAFLENMISLNNIFKFDYVQVDCNVM
jgi:phosphoribosylformimino-5-aminoimidazole carboxamide ribotide isomerase